MIPQYEPPLKGLARLGYIISNAYTPRHPDWDTTTRFLDRVYPVPDPTETARQFEIYNHIDLDDMPLEALQREERKIQHRLDQDDKPPRWLWGRLEAVRQAMARHHASNRRDASAPVRGRKPPSGRTPRPHTRGISLAVRHIDREAQHE